MIARIGQLKNILASFALAFIFIAPVLAAAALNWQQAMEQGDDLPTLESLQTYHSMERPKLSIPSDLIVVPVVKPTEYHVPPSVHDIPESKYGEMVTFGRQLFINTQVAGKRFVGNSLNCSNCHLQEGRKPHAAPLWASYPMYPMYRNKNQQVVTFQERIQDCFRFSINGLAPTLDSYEIEAMTSYAHWLATGIPMGIIVAGRGFTRIDKSHKPSSFNGEVIYKQQCSLCHGEDTLGKKYKDRKGYMFPPLSGPDSYNRAAGMDRVKTCAAFVKANMPLGKPFTINDDDALEVCLYLRFQNRPWDPRKSYFTNIFMPISEQ